MTCECGHEDDEHRIKRRGARADCQVEGCGCAYFEHAAECEDGAEGAMTLNELRPLAEAAKAWRPWHWCAADAAVGLNDGSLPCQSATCLGAARAVEDINRHVCDALAYIATLPTDPLRDGDTAATKLSSAEYEARCAARIASCRCR